MDSVMWCLSWLRPAGRRVPIREPLQRAPLLPRLYLSRYPDADRLAAPSWSDSAASAEWQVGQPCDAATASTTALVRQIKPTNSKADEGRIAAQAPQRKIVSMGR